MKRSSRYAWLIGLCILAAGAIVVYYTFDRVWLPTARPVTPQESATDPSDPPWADAKPKDVRHLPE